jgi:hypothetical protein
LNILNIESNWIIAYWTIWLNREKKLRGTVEGITMLAWMLMSPYSVSSNCGCWNCVGFWDSSFRTSYRGTSLIRNKHPVGPYSSVKDHKKHTPRTLSSRTAVAGTAKGERLVHWFANTPTSRQRGGWDETLGLWQPVDTLEGGFILWNDTPWIAYRGTSLIRNTPPVGPCSALCLGTYGGPVGGCFRPL